MRWNGRCYLTEEIGVSPQVNGPKSKKPNMEFAADSIIPKRKSPNTLVLDLSQSFRSQ